MKGWRELHRSVPGKWILAGEHSVLRGAMAVALPHPEFSLTLSFTPEPEAQGLVVAPDEASSTIEELLGLLLHEEADAFREVGLPKGRLRVESSIPVGAGLGSSAALCVAVSRWAIEAIGIPSSREFEIATQLENHFHGKSSGMDIAAASFAEPIVFVKGKGTRGIRPLGVARLPRFSFHDTGIRMATREAVARVEQLRDEDFDSAENIDQAMGRAARTAMEGLLRYNAGDTEPGLKLLTEAMTLAQECFAAWDLVPPEAATQARKLLDSGARAVKLTGAGGGGFLVALWD